MDVPPPPQAVVERYFAAINARNWDALRQILHEDFSLRVVAAGVLHGIEAAVDYYEPLLARFEEGIDTPTRYLVSGNSVTVEIDFVGRTVDGRDVAFPAVDVFDISAGRIRSLSVWYDSLGVAHQVKGRLDRRPVTAVESALAAPLASRVDLR